MKGKKLTFFDKLTLVPAIIAAIALIGGAMAGQFDPRNYVLIAFLGLAYPFLLLINILFLGWWMLRKKWVTGLITLAVIGSGYSTLHATFKFSGNTNPPEQQENLLRLMTYNVHNFKGYGEKNSIDIKRKMLSVIRKQQPDIVCFQEFYTRFKGEFDIADSIKTMLNSPYYYFVPSSKNSYEAIGMAIFSKYPIKNQDYIALDNNFGGNGSIYIDIDFQNKPLRIYNLHLRSISFQKQDYTYLNKVKNDIKPNKKSSKRIYRMLRDAFKKRADHVDLMKAAIKKSPGSFIIAGDFNDTPASYAVHQLTNNLTNAFVAQGKGLGRTYNGAFPNFQIDYIATSKDIAVESYYITKAKLSDHYPVRSDLKWKETEAIKR